MPAKPRRSVGPAPSPALLAAFLAASCLAAPARAMGDLWSWWGGFAVLSPGGELAGIPGAPGVAVRLQRPLSKSLTLSADAALAEHRVAGVDIAHWRLCAGPGLLIGGASGTRARVGVGWGWSRFDYVQVPIRMEGGGPFFSLGLILSGSDGGDAAFELSAHIVDAQDQRGIPSEGWTLSFSILARTGP